MLESVREGQILPTGVLKYTPTIAIPSINSGDVPYEDYYALPWEVTADLHGEVQRDGTTPEDIAVGLDYLEYAKNWPFSYNQWNRPYGHLQGR